MADHWWWRPGWGPGSRFYTWHLTFNGAPEVHRLAATYRSAFADVPGLDLVPDTWLHLTMQGLGHAGQVPDGDVEAIVAAARWRLSAIPAFTLALDRPAVTPEAIRWDPNSQGPAAVRSAIRAAIGDVWPDVPEAAEGFAAHVTIAYSNAVGPALPVLDALATVPSRPTDARVASAELIVLNRDNRMYEWETRASIPLGVH
jgi:2'-5' RNA ligase